MFNYLVLQMIGTLSHQLWHVLLITGEFPLQIYSYFMNTAFSQFHAIILTTD